MLFNDRYSAGEQLAELLTVYKEAQDTLILGLPRGGVVTAYAVAQKLHLPLDVTCPRKIGAPFNPEFAIGAITETGEGFFNEALITRLGISKEYIAHEIKKERERATARLKMFRRDLPPRQLQGKTVILMDDGLATGATMKAAIASVRKEQAEIVIVAVPVAPLETLQEIQALVDQAFCLETPSFFEAVGQFYLHFTQVEDAEVLALLQKNLII
jgi:putative phosphoribosyl transferase